MLVQDWKIKLIAALALTACAVLMLAPCAGAQQLYVTSEYYSNVFRYDAAGNPAPAPGQSGAMFANLGGTWNGYGVAIGNDGYVYFARNDAGVVVRYNKTTGLQDTSWSVSLSAMDLQFGPNGSLYATQYGGSAKVWKIDTAAQTYSTVLTGASLPFCMDIDAQGRGYLTNYGGAKVLRYNEVAGSWIQDAAFDGSMPNDEKSYGVAVDKLGRVYATNYTGNVYRFDSAGNVDTTWAVTALSPGQDYQIAIGPDNNPYVTSSWYIFKLDANDDTVQTVFVDRVVGRPYDYLRWDSTVPEPGSLLALGVGLVSCFGIFRRRR